MLFFLEQWCILFHSRGPSERAVLIQRDVARCIREQSRCQSYCRVQLQPGPKTVEMTGMKAVTKEHIL